MLDSLNILKFSADYIISIIGVIFLLSYFATKNPLLLIPGVMLSLFSLILLFNLYNLPYMWLLGISLSFFAVYITKEKYTLWALIPGSILLAMTIIAVFEFYTEINAFPIILIMLGAYLLYKNYKKGKK
jgi:signal transduction histidine kinase